MESSANERADAPLCKGLDELAEPFESVAAELHRGCNELLAEDSHRPVPDTLLEEARLIWQDFHSVSQGRLAEGNLPRIAEAWSLLLSKVQAEALDRADIPHPPELIPVTEEQQRFWANFAARSGKDAGNEEGLAALSQEWTAAATIVEALSLAGVAARRRGGTGGTAGGIAVLGPGPGLEYARGAEALEAQLVELLGALRPPGAPEVRVIFCGPEVPQELDGTKRHSGACVFEHVRGCWHELQASRGSGAAGAKESLPAVGVYIALNAGTSVGEYKAGWLQTLQCIAASGGFVFVTGYTLPEAEDARRDILQVCPTASHWSCTVNRTATLLGHDRIELGVTPCSYAGKSNYSRCCAWLPPSTEGERAC